MSIVAARGIVAGSLVVNPLAASYGTIVVNGLRLLPYVPPIIIRSATVSLLTPQVLRNTVNAGSTLRFAASFQDDDYDAIFPDSIAWSLLDLDRRQTITAGTLSDPADDSDITIAPQYNPMRSTYGAQLGRRALVVTASYNTTDAITAQCLFSVRSFQ